MMNSLKHYENEKQIEMIIYGALALSFQPLFKIALGRELWNIIDVVVGIGLMIIVVKDRMMSQPKAIHICKKNAKEYVFANAKT